MLRFGVLSYHFVAQGATGTPNRHLDVQLSISTDFRVQYGTLLGPTLGILLWFSVILDTKMGDSFQVRVFGDPGMEMMPECSSCMCLNHNQNCGFWVIPLFPLIHQFYVRREGFRCHFGVCWWPWGHFFWFLRVLETGWNFQYFGIPPGSPKAESIQDWKVKVSSWGPGEHIKSKNTIPLLLIWDYTSTDDLITADPDTTLVQMTW